MDKKYRLTGHADMSNGYPIYQIQALKDFRDVKAGDLGGYVASEENLSQDGDCWIGEDVKLDKTSKVTDNAVVSGKVSLYDATVSKNAKVIYSGSQETYINRSLITDDATVNVTHKSRIDDSIISENAEISVSICASGKIRHNAAVHRPTIRGNAKVCNSTVYDHAIIEGDAKVEHSRLENYAYVGENAHLHCAVVKENGRVMGNAYLKCPPNAGVGKMPQVYGDAEVSGNAKIGGGVQVYGDATVTENAVIKGDCDIYDRAIVKGDAVVPRKTQLCDNAFVQSSADVMPLKLEDPSAKRPTAFRTRNDRILVMAGGTCTLDEFKQHVQEIQNQLDKATSAIVAMENNFRPGLALTEDDLSFASQTQQTTL